MLLKNVVGKQSHPVTEIELLEGRQLLSANVAAAASDAGRTFGDTRVFARVPTPPGLPEGIATAADGSVWVDTNPGGNAPNTGVFGSPSQVLHYSADGTLLQRFTIRGQNVASVALPSYGLQANAFDAAGNLYIADKSPARIIKLDPKTGKQTTYATFPDLKPQVVAGDGGSATLTDLRPFPDYIAFGPDGSLYVTDFQQATIFRVPPGGGTPTIAFTSLQLDSGMGANGIQFSADGKKAFFVTSVNPPAGTVLGVQAATSTLYSLDLQSNGTLRNLTPIYTSPPANGFDGFALSANGNFYINLFIANQILEVSSSGQEVARIGTAVLGTNGSEILFSSPASSVFVGNHLLVTNHSVNVPNPASYAVLDVYVGEAGVPLFRPTFTTSGSGTTATTAVGVKSPLISFTPTALNLDQTGQTIIQGVRI